MKLAILKTGIIVSLCLILFIIAYQSYLDIKKSVEIKEKKVILKEKLTREQKEELVSIPKEQQNLTYIFNE